MCFKMDTEKTSSILISHGTSSFILDSRYIEPDIICCLEYNHNWTHNIHMNVKFLTSMNMCVAQRNMRTTTIQTRIEMLCAMPFISDLFINFTVVTAILVGLY